MPSVMSCGIAGSISQVEPPHIHVFPTSYSPKFTACEATWTHPNMQARNFLQRRLAFVRIDGKKAIMSKLDDAIVACKEQMKKQKIPCNDDLLRAIAKSLGPSLFKQDAKLVAAAQPKEIKGIKEKFLIKKLGCKDDAKLDTAIEYAIDKIGRSNRAKLRPVFYYLLVKKLKKESEFV